MVVVDALFIPGIGGIPGIGPIPGIGAIPEEFSGAGLGFAFIYTYI
jgi:hypothetical protein